MRTDIAELKRKLKDTFASGGYPTRNYVDRTSVTRQLDNAIDTRKVIILTGYTKSGKTVLAKKYFETRNTIWIESGRINDENDFWNCFSNILGFASTTEVTKSFEVEKSSGEQLLLNFASPVASAESRIDKRQKERKNVVNKQIVSHDAKHAVLQILKEYAKDYVIVIDDFHYLKEEIKKTIIRAFKSHIQDGLNLVLIAIPSRKEEVIIVEREMAARMHAIEVPSWNEDELALIAKKGFDYLNVDIEDEVVERMSVEAYGSPHLMQDFCLNISLMLLDEEKYMGATLLTPTDEDFAKTFKEIANRVGRPIFTQLANGPLRERTRKKRELKDGKIADTYSLVAHALSLIKPGIDKVKFQKLAEIVHSLLKNESDMPQRFEITRVLKYMAKIAVSDSASNPVIDVDEKDRCLCVIDPYFAYFLKWGNCEID